MLPSLVDTHAHICDPVFDPDRAQVLARAAKAGITAVIAVGEDMNDARRNLELSVKHPILKAAVGLYPDRLSMDDAEEMCGFIREHKSRICGIGEVGLDFWVVRDDENKKIQMDIFSTFIRLSIELGRPLNVHSRSAGRHAIKMLLDHGARQVQLHAFDGKYTTALPAIEAGYFFSIPPSVVRSRQKQKLVKHLPLESLLLETDCPVLGPDKSLRNEPANLQLALEAISEIKGISKERLMEIVENNTRRLYPSI